jgi:hypothetical protein
MGTESGEGRETVGMATTTVERGHERDDASVRAIFWVGAGLVALAALIQVVLYFHMAGLWRLRQRAFPPPSPVAGVLPSEPPAPRLETAPALDLRTLRAAENAQLHDYGWVDRGAGVVHIPIERAMDLVAREAERESAQAGRWGPGASEERSEQGERAADGPSVSFNAERKK